MTTGKALVCAAMMGGVFCAHAATWYVAPAPTGDDDNNDGSSGSPFATIQKGIDSAAKNDTVEIGDGTYYITSPLTLDGKDIELKSAAEDPTKVIVDAQRLCSCVSNGTEKFHNIINSITFQNGYSRVDGHVAGGIYSAGKTLVTNCVVRDCYHEASVGDAYGGGINIKNPSGNIEDPAWNWPVGRQFLSTVVDTLVTNCAVCSKDGTAPKTVRGGGVALTYLNVIRLTVRNCAVTNSSLNSADYESYTAGGGVYFLGSVGTNCVIEGNCAVDTDSKLTFLGVGGGAYLYGYAARHCRFVDSLVINNYAMSAGGGIACVQNCDVLGCTVTNNLVGNPKAHGRYQPGGGGIYVNGSNVSIEDSLIAHNDTTIDNGPTSYHGGGLAFTGGFNHFLANCVIRDNVASIAGAISVVGLNSLMVTNCVIAQNACTNQYSVLRLFSTNTSQDGFGAVCADCLIISNENRRAATAGSRSMIYYTTPSKSKDGQPRYAAPFHLRNCYFAGNSEMSSSGTWGLRLDVSTANNIFEFEEGVRPIVIDHCTFVTNKNSSSVTSFIGCEDLGGQNTRIEGCMLYGNIGGTSTLAGIVDSTGEVAISNTFCEVENTTFTVTPENGNLSSGDLKFRNEAAWDFRPDAGSCLIDKGGPFADWMGSGAKGSPSRDIGDGRYTEERIGKYGVRVVRTNTNPRRYGTASDMGCFEFWAPLGLHLLIR